MIRAFIERIKTIMLMPYVEEAMRKTNCIIEQDAEEKGMSAYDYDREFLRVNQD